MMNSKLTPEDIINNDRFELLAELKHQEIKEFILNQILYKRALIRSFGIYQIAMAALFLFILVKGIILFNRGFSEPILWIGFSVLFSLTFLVIIHEFIHAIAYWIKGARRLKVGAILKKFIFYIIADREVINYPDYRFVALAPLVFIKIISILFVVFYWSSPAAYFFLSIMCFHSLFCGGDIAMLTFYKIHDDKEIYNFDDVKTGKTFFYIRKHDSSIS